MHDIALHLAQTVSPLSPLPPLSLARYSLQSCPQPQTSEHLAAIEIMKLGRERLPVIILQNKIDLMRESQAREQYDQILHFVRGTCAEDAPIVPISAQLKYNIECVCEYIVCARLFEPLPLSHLRCLALRGFPLMKFLVPFPRLSCAASCLNGRSETWKIFPALLHRPRTARECRGRGGCFRLCAPTRVALTCLGL